MKALEAKIKAEKAEKEAVEAQIKADQEEFKKMFNDKVKAY